MNSRATEALASSESVVPVPLVLPQRPVAVPSQGAAGLVVPPDDQLRVVRADAKAAGKLRDLHQMVTAWEAVAKKCDLVFEEMVRLAVFRLEVERDLGAELTQTVRHGGDRSRSPRGILLRAGSLPDGVSPKQSSQYQRLAAMPIEVFQAYLEKARDERKVPSSAGARRFAAPARPRPTKSPGKASLAGAVELPRAVLEAVSRIMTPDVCVGRAQIQARCVVSPSANSVFDALDGDVFVAECNDPATWLSRLRMLRNAAQVQRAIVVLPAEVWAAWFDLLRQGDWLCCFLRDARDESGRGRVLAHCGAKQSSFRVALSEFGTFL